MPKAEMLATAEDHHQRALALFQAGEHQAAARVLGELLEAEESAEVWNDWATAQLLCSQIVDAERGYRRALEMDPSNNRAAGNLGALLAKNGYIAEALPFLQIAAKTSSGEEREQLLRLIQCYRHQLAKASSKTTADPNLLTQMSGAIYQQSLAIAALLKRVTALEAGASRPPAVHTNSVPLAAGHSTPGSGTANSISVPDPGASCQSKPKPGVLFCGSIYEGTGFAEESWAAALALAERGIPLQLAPAGETQDSKNLISKEAGTKLETLQRQSVDIPKSIIYQAAPANAWNMSVFGRTRVGRTMYETDRIPDSYREPSNAMDEVWVASRFNLETFAAGGVDPRKLRFVPGGIDTAIFRPGVEPLNVPQKRGFNFVSVFDWHQGKGYDILLRAYLREFKADEDVALILKVYQLNNKSSDLPAIITHFIEREAKLSLEKSPAIILLNGFLTQKDMVRLYAAGNCFVLPTHGEGYGRPFLEAQACELPVIATGWGGQTDFLNIRNSYPIENKIVDVPKDAEINISAGHRWAQPDEEHLRSLMREVYSHPESARAKARQGRQDVRKGYDWSVVARLWADEFERLLG